MGGPVNTVIGDLHTIEQAAHSVGLALNQVKSELIGGSSHPLWLLHSASFTFNEIDKGSACLLGASLDCAGVDAALALKRCNLDSLITRLYHLPTHVSLFLLKNVFAIPKLMYILLTAPCVDSPELAKYDASLCDAVSLLTNVDLSDTRWQQASLPIWAG